MSRAALSLALPPLTLLALALAFTLTFLGQTAPAAAPPVRGPAPADIARWIRDLGDDEFAVREAATRKLREAGEAAEAALEKVAASDDREVARRVQGILIDFRWGVFPDTPDKVVDLIKAYQGAARGEKGKVIRQLIGTGRPGWKALTRITRAEEDPLVRKEVFALLAGDMARIVPVMLADGDVAGLEGLVELGLAGDPRTGMGNYVAFWALRGQLPERIALHQARAKKPGAAKAEAEILMHLHRARGDRVAALAAAKEADRNDLIEALYFEASDWKTLAARPELMGAGDPVERLGLKAAYHRLAGEEKESAAAIADLRKLTEDDKTESEGPLPLQVAKALFLNAQPGPALETLAKARQFDLMRFELHLARHEIKAARAVLEAVRKAKGSNLDEMEIGWARARHALGEKAEARKTFDEFAARIKKPAEAGWYAELIDAELRSGLADLAWEHAGRVVAASDEEGWPRRLLDKLTPDLTEESLAVFYLLRQTTDPEKALARVRVLFGGKATAKDLDDLAALVEKEKDGRPLQRPGLLWLAAGEAALLSKNEGKARAWFARAGGSAGLSRLADRHAAAKEWGRAAEFYLKAHERATASPTEPLEDGERRGDTALELYLAAGALERAGDAAGAKKRREQAHWLPLGNGAQRSELVRALLKRDLRDDMRREARALVVLGEPALHEPDSFHTAEAQRVLAVDAAGRKDHQAAADGYDRAVLRVLRPTVNFARPVAYAAIPAFIHRNRALGLAQAGKLAEAVAEARRCLEALPGNIDVVLALVPELEKGGRKDDADRLYRAARDVYEGVAKEYPGSAWAHNSSAWLSACCRRDLEEALVHARRGVELSPLAGHHDTLAEVLFQLGRQAEAVAEQKKAVALDPKRMYFKKQLARIEAGDPKAPRPPEEDE